MVPLDLPAGRSLGHEQVEEILARELGLDLRAMPCRDPKRIATSEPSLPPISVVVCTRDRAGLLRSCLETLRRLDYPEYDVVVVDNASRDDQTAAVTAQTPFRYVRQDRPGLDWARNRGAAEARHEIIAYVDDDARADPAWLRGVADAFADPRVGLVTGLVLPWELETEAQELFEQYGGMGKGVRSRLFHPGVLSAESQIATHCAGVGANMALRRTTWEAVGGFDTALDVGTPSFGAGDLDMFHRVLTAGLAIRYEPTAIVWHQHRRDMSGLRRQIYSNGRSFGVYLIKLWRTGSVERHATVRFAGWWVKDWLLGRLLRCVLRREPFPTTLAWAEVWGACHAPWAYLATYSRNRRLLRKDRRAC